MTETMQFEEAKIQTKIIVKNLFKALSSLKQNQLYQLYGELFTESEAEILAKRLEIARSLLTGESYASLQKRLKVTPNTISQINKILKSPGQGFKLAAEVIENNSELKQKQPLMAKREGVKWLRYFLK